MSNNFLGTGWSNKETWIMYNLYGKIFANMAEERKYDDLEHMANSFEFLVEEREYEGVKKRSIAESLLSMYLYRVDWKEIARHYFKEKKEEEESDIEGLRELLREV